MNWTIITQVTALLFLFTGAVFDARTGEVPLVLMGAGFLSGLFLSLFGEGRSLSELLLGCIPGVAVLIFALLTRQAVGYGDGLALVCTGVFLGLTGNLILLGGSLLIASLTAIFLLAMKKVRRKSSLPFLPFLLAGYVGLLAIY